MYLLLRFSPVLSSLGIFILMAFLLFPPASLLEWLNLEKPSVQYVATIVSFTFLMLVFTMIFIGAGQRFRDRLRFLLFPILMLASVWGIILFSDNRVFLGILWVLTPIACWVWYESLYLYWQRPVGYQAYTLERLSGDFYLLAVFLFTYALTGVQVLLQIPLWVSLLAASAVFFLIQYDLLQLQKLAVGKSLFFALLGTILSLELLIVLNLLPTHFLFFGLSVGLFFYVWLGIGTGSIKEHEEDSKSFTYLIIGSLGFILAFTSTFWLR